MSVILDATNSSGFGITADNSGIVQFQSVGANTVSINTNGQMTILSTSGPQLTLGNSTSSAKGVLVIAGQSLSNGAACTGVEFIAKRFGNTALQSGQWASYFYTEGWDGTAGREMAYIAVGVDATPANNTIPSYIQFYTTPIGTNQVPELAMEISNDKKVSIGGANPTYNIDLVGDGTVVSRTRSRDANAAYSLFQNSVTGTTGSNGLYVGVTSNAVSSQIWNYENTPLVFATNNTEQMRLDAAGLVQINTTTTYPNASSFVTINGNMANTYGITIRNSGTTYGTTTRYVNFINSSNAVAGYIQQNAATTVVYTASSDARLKTNITDSPSTLNMIDNIRVRSYDWIDGGGHTQFGFIAQELHSYIPDAVYPGGDVDSNPWTIDYGRLTPFLMKAVQELKAENDALKARVEALENK